MRLLCCCAIATMLGVFVGVPVTAQSTDSQTRAQELVKRLSGAGPVYFAAPMPDDDSRFVAALHIPNLQLLVISAKYSAPPLLKELLLKSEYQRVYLDLNSAADRQGRFFVEDLGADGLRAERKENAPFDITWRNASTRTLYNGSEKDQNLSEEEYRQRFAKDADEYAQLLQVLIEAYAAKSTTRER